MVHGVNVKKRSTRQVLTLFNVIIEDKHRILSLVRFVPDFIELDMMIKRHYRKSKVSLPQISEPHLELSMNRYRFPGRKRFRALFSRMAKLKSQRSNCEKIENYLRKCALDPVIGRSTVFRDFLSVQREEDSVSPKALVENYVHQRVLEEERNRVSEDFSLTSPEASARRSSSLHPASILSISSSNTSSRSSVHSIASIAMSDSQIYLGRNSEEPQHMSMTDDDGDDDEEEEEEDQKNDEPVMKRKMTIQDFQFIKVLGKGCMGKVLLVRHQRSSRLLALKAISKEWVVTQREIEHTKMERDILATIASIRHPFLIKLHHSFQDASQLFLVLDYHVGGDLATQLTKFVRFPPERCRLYTAEILLGMQELHRLGILYRDLKPENILLAADGHVVLTDFGLSKQFMPDNEDQRTRTFCGTAEYLAPEILQSEDYSFAVDFWSLGTILFEMLTGVTPFWAETHSEMYRRVLEDELEFPEDFDPLTADFIRGLLEREPTVRLGAGPDGPITIRSHPYFDVLDWSDVYHKRIRPPYVPNLHSETDFSNFDEDFLRMSPRLSPVVDDALLSQSVQQAFNGYSYNDSHYLGSSIAETKEENEEQGRLLGFYNDSDGVTYDFYTESDIQPNDSYADLSEPEFLSDYGTSEDQTPSSEDGRRLHRQPAFYTNHR
ncbi:hypothetical protein EC973_008927 [Apophysomyces ossiformis]|uniref:Uncharacterized protein n=1 Tax=Apophysomyces ossiformis TaxID=679940 RepID=A0A8H7EQQ4_9FUNG|nr:hypothetical protein EC973_008927 [Apophysomyces ossiformis]